MQSEFLQCVMAGHGGARGLGMDVEQFGMEAGTVKSEYLQCARFGMEMHGFDMEVRGSLARICTELT